MVKFAYLSKPAYLEVEESDCFVSEVKLSIWDPKNPIEVEGLDVIWRLPLYINDIPIRMPESKVNTAWSYGFVDWEVINNIQVDIVPDYKFLSFPFTDRYGAGKPRSLGRGCAVRLLQLGCLMPDALV